MWVSLYLTAQELLNTLGNAGPLTEVSESSVINSVELSLLVKLSFNPPNNQSVVSFNTTDAADPLGSFSLMDIVLVWPKTMHETRSTVIFFKKNLKHERECVGWLS